MLTILGYYLYYSLTEGGLELPKATATGIVGAYGGLVRRHSAQSGRSRAHGAEPVAARRDWLDCRRPLGRRSVGVGTPDRTYARLTDNEVGST